MGVYGTGYNYPLYKLRSADDAAKLRRRRGRNGYNKAAGGKKHQWLGWISKPEHLMTWPVWTDYNYQEPVVDLEVWREATFFDRNDIQTWGETKLFETSIDHPGYKNPNGKINVSFQAPAPTRPTGRVLLRDWFRPAPVLNPNLGDSARRRNARFPTVGKPAIASVKAADYLRRVLALDLPDGFGGAVATTIVHQNELPLELPPLEGMKHPARVRYSRARSAAEH